MNKTKTSSQLKSLAKGQLLGNYTNVISAYLCIKVIEVLFGLVALTFSSTRSLAGALLYLGVSFIIELLTGILDLGETFFFLNITCNKTTSISDIFYGFKKHPDKPIAIKFFVTILCSLPTIPFIIFAFIYITNPSASLFVFCCILFIAGYGCSIFFALMYSQVFYVFLDFEHLNQSALELLAKSKDLMKGHKARLFYIWISFIPLFLVGFMSCGIAFLWLLPYVKSTMTNFYLDIIQSKKV